MIIPYQKITQEALHSLIEDHITSGADQYKGNLERDIINVTKALESGELVIEYAETDESTRIRRKEDLLTTH